MSTVTLEGSTLDVVIIIILFLMMAFQWLWMEKKLLDFKDMMNTTKTLPATIKKQFKAAVREELENMDWNEVAPELGEQQNMLSTIISNLDKIVGVWEYMKQGGSIVKEVSEVAAKAASETIKDEVKPKKK